MSASLDCIFLHKYAEIYIFHTCNKSATDRAILLISDVLGAQCPRKRHNRVYSLLVKKKRRTLKVSYTNNSFFTIYDLGLKRKRWNCTTISKQLSEQEGIEISPRSLQRYRTKEMRPNFQVAKAIFKVLEIIATDEQISEMLEFARKEKVQNYTASKYIERGVRIRTILLSDEDKPERYGRG